ncbi:hypothetical protein [Streptomyces sp. NPDC020377]|uniref:hypothetical protein n=1 Tax=Streptomyces sp. NPDC020377 TaxID=3365070 RepID=UPI00379C92B4
MVRLGLEVTAVVGRIAERGAALGLGLGLGTVWWWAVLRLAVAPDAGLLEGAVAAGGWGLSLLPVHCVAKVRAVGAVGEGRWRAAWRGAAGGAGAGGGGRVGGGMGGGGGGGAEG